MTQPNKVKEFLDQPGKYIHADYVQDLLPDLPPHLAAAILSCQRLEPKISEMIVRKYNLGHGDNDIKTEDAAIAISDPDRLLKVALGAGAIWNAHRLRLVIDGKHVADILSGLDPTTYNLALANLDLSAVPRPEFLDTSISSLAASIRTDGLLCLQAWLMDIPAALGTRVRLKLPQTFLVAQTPSPSHLDLGPEMIRRAAAWFSNVPN